MASRHTVDRTPPPPEPEPELEPEPEPEPEPERLITAHDLLYNDPMPNVRTELVAGRLIVREVPKPRHGLVAARLLRVLNRWLDADRIASGAARDRGTLFSNDSGFLLRRDPDTVRGPDIAYIVNARMPPDLDTYPDMAPDLVIEVRSPSDRARYLRQKIADWQHAGCQHIWIADPQRTSLTVHDHASVVTLHAGDLFDGGPLFPGLQLDVAPLFD